MWKEQYSRHLSHTSDSDLVTRREDVLINLLSFTEDGYPKFDKSIITKPFLERLNLINEEMRQRSKTLFSNLLDNPSIYQKEYPNIQRAIKAWENRELTMGEYLIKFGKLKHLSAMINQGKIRLNSASFYGDFPNNAICDQELVQNWTLPKGTKLYRSDSGEYKEISGIKNISLKKNSPTDFYIYSMARLYQHRLFDDFEADACLVVYDLKKFFSRLLGFLKIHYPNWLFKSGDIKYYDPLFPSPYNVHFSKEMRFWYQCEYRIVVMPEISTDELHPVDIEIGELKDCSYLISLLDWLLAQSIGRVINRSIAN